MFENREQHIKATFDVFKPNGIVEIRTFNNFVKSGYFQDRENLVKQILANDSDTWYFVMNEIDEACYSREQSEKILSKKGLKTTSDGEIKGIDWILIDADPKRATGVSSTDEEKEKALIQLRHIYAYLRKVGFSEPVVCDSGNGYHLLYKVSISKNDTEKIKLFLQALGLLFDNEYVDIDKSVFNPSRITKVYGTIARKGANTIDRPHRASGFIKIPNEIKLTSIQLIDKVIKILPKPEKPTYRNNYESKFDIDSFIEKHRIDIAKDTAVNGVRRIVLSECPFDSNHKSPDSAIFVLPDGAIGFKCFHNSCQDKTWKDVRLLYEPNAYENKADITRTTKADYEPVKQQEPVKEDTPQPNKFLRLQDIESIDRSKIVCIPTGITALDKQVIGMAKGEMTIWSGGNGSGKSTLLSQLAIEAIEKGFNVAMFSGEMTANRIKNWLHLQSAGRQNVTPTQYENLFNVPPDKAKLIDEWIGEKLWIYNNDYGFDFQKIIEDFKIHIEKYKTDLVIIDNLMTLDFNSLGNDKYENQSRVIKQFSAFAKKHNIHVHFVCHPRKPNGFLRKSDISGSADITNLADNVIMVHRINKDFERYAKDFFGEETAKKYFCYTNAVELLKSREQGIESLFGLYYEKESKRLLNHQYENRHYSWEDKCSDSFIWSGAEDLPFV